MTFNYRFNVVKESYSEPTSPKFKGKEKNPNTWDKHVFLSSMWFLVQSFARQRWFTRMIYSFNKLTQHTWFSIFGPFCNQLVAFWPCNEYPQYIMSWKYSLRSWDSTSNGFLQGTIENTCPYYSQRTKLTKFYTNAFMCTHLTHTHTQMKCVLHGSK